MFLLQERSIHNMLKSDKNLVIASHTGSGKTLAFLLPLIELLKRDEVDGSRALPKRPKALILVPTRELADQVRMHIS